MRKLALGLLAALSFLAPSVAAAQTCPAVAALPDSERRVAYSPSASTGPFSVTFAILGDSTDYGAWVEVWLNGVMLTPITEWQLTIPVGTLATACRPITNASITLTTAATGTLQIVGARRPRRTSQLSESQGVSARNFNQIITDLTAQNRETWDKINDVTGRAVIGLPGENVTPLEPAATRASKFFIFDAAGNPSTASPTPGLGNVVGPSTSVIGHTAVWASTNGTLLADGAGLINVKGFGAIGDCSTDDSTAIQAAITAAEATATTIAGVEAGGGRVYFPAAPCYRIATRLTSTKPIAFVGDGRLQSVIGVDNASGGISITATLATDAWLIQDLGFKAMRTSAGVAIAHNGVSTSSLNFPNLQIKSVHIWQDALSGFYFTSGITYNNCWHCVIDDVFILGATAVANWMTAGIDIGTKSIDGRILNTYIYGAVKGINVSATDAEGVEIYQSSIVASTNGIVSNHVGTATLDLIVKSSHLAVSNSCVNATGPVSIFIEGNLCYLGDQGTSATPNGAQAILISGTNRSTVRGNIIEKTAGAATGTIGTQYTNSSIFNNDRNIYAGFNVGINIDALSVTGQIGQNNFTSVATPTASLAACSTVSIWDDGAGAMCGVTSLNMGGTVTAQKLLVFSSGNARYGLGVAANELRVFAPSDSHVSLGTISTGDGSTWSEKLRVNNDGATTITSAAAGGLSVGRLGATTPAFLVDASTGTSITGLKVKSAATAGGVAVSAIGETNVQLNIDAAGSGVISLAATSTGQVQSARNIVVGGASAGNCFNHATRTGMLVKTDGFEACANGVPIFANRNNTSGAGDVFGIYYNGAPVGSLNTDTTGVGLGSAAAIVLTGSNITSNANLTFTAATKTVVLKQGANGTVGTFVCNGATPVTVNNTNVAITDTIIISLNTVGGTVGAQPNVRTITAATGFTVACTAADTSTMNYSIIKNAAWLLDPANDNRPMFMEMVG